MLQGLGQNLIKAGSGREALKWLLTHDFAVVLLDVKMPEMDGFETADAHPASATSPATRRSSSSPRPTRARPRRCAGYAVGAVDYLVKPVVPEFVRSKVAVFVELAKKTELLRRQARAAAGERAGGPRAGRDPGRAGAGPGAQEPRARELQLRRVARPAGAAPPDRELQPGGAGEPGRAAGRGRAGATSTGCARPASRCRSSSTTCSTWRASPGPRCGSRRWT